MSTSTARRVLTWAIGALAACAVTVHAQSPTPSPSPTDVAPPAGVLPLAPENLWNAFPRPDVEAPFLPLDGAWPARVGGTGSRQGLIIEAELGMTRPDGQRSGVDLPVLPVSAVKDAAALVAWAKPERADWSAMVEGEGSFVVGVKPLPEGAPRRLRDTADLTFRFVSGQEVAPGVVRIERTWFQYFAPLPQASQPQTQPIGLVVFMPGLFGTPEGTIDGLSKILRERGFGVLRMVAQPARFTERLTFTFDPAARLEDAGARAAELIDGRAAECAYSVHAALDYVQNKRPELAQAPITLLGFSAGAITLPAVVARQPDRFVGAVMVGGGCHWWHLLEVSNYRTMIDAVDVTWSGEHTAEHEARVRAGYLAASRLDAFNTAQSMRQTPTLFIMGTTDMAVPAPLGEALWARLGKPERIDIEGGHEVLFMQLPKHFTRIADWMEAAVKPPSGPRGTP